MTNDDTAILPLVVASDADGQSLEAYASARRQEIDADLLQHGAILFRDFGNEGGLDSIASRFFPSLLAYTYRSTPRSNLGQYVYTATEYPKQLWIPQHNENAYQLSWPMKLLFHCEIAAERGGCTPLASTLAVTEAIDPEIREEFARRGVKYVRNYRPGIDLPWEEVFGTNSRAEVERFCQQHRIELEWTRDGLRTSQNCPAFATHPATGQRLWFNQAHLFHVSSQEPKARETLLALFGESGLPRNAYFGDGGAIAEDMLEHIRAAYASKRTSFPWQSGDVLLVDNMLVTHGREPYEGARKVLVCMAEAHSPSGIDGSPEATDSEMVRLYV